MSAVNCTIFMPTLTKGRAVVLCWYSSHGRPTYPDLIQTGTSYIIYVSQITLLSMVDIACPSCQIHFHAQMLPLPMGLDKNMKNVYLHYQLCPKCKEPVVGITRGGIVFLSDSNPPTILHE
jgi:tetrahydromethanopterin S-methyltransferase subunit E